MLVNLMFMFSLGCIDCEFLAYTDRSEVVALALVLLFVALCSIAFVFFNACVSKLVTTVFNSSPLLLSVLVVVL